MHTTVPHSQQVLVLLEDDRVATQNSRAATGTVFQATASVVNIFVGTCGRMHLMAVAQWPRSAM